MGDEMGEGKTDVMLTADELAKMLGISRGAVYDLAAPKGPIQCVRHGRRCIRFCLANVEAYVQSCTHTQVARPQIMPRYIPPIKIKISEPLNCFARRGIVLRPKLGKK